ncbi:MAG: class I SAM-dependent methyltransferase [Pseudomonadota bacterium]
MAGDQTPHLPEDAFLAQFLGAMALEFAMRQGLIDQWASGTPLPKTQSAMVLRAMLASSGVIDDAGLTPAFRAVLDQRREVLVEKLRFLRLAAKDVVNGLDHLLTDLPSFMGQSETFALFRYDQAKTTSPEHIAATRPWVTYVTALSRAEAPVLAPLLPLAGARWLLEIGGNTGVMARAALDLHPDLQAVICDLPAVCAIGEEMNDHPRLAFAPGDARAPDWPDVAGAQPDTVLFKSVLHDWPRKDAEAMIDRALAHLAPGGRLIICERGAFGQATLPFSMTANLVFAPFYRPPGDYAAAFAARGMANIAQVDTMLDMPFHIVSGCKS